MMDSFFFIFCIFKKVLWLKSIMDLEQKNHNDLGYLIVVKGELWLKPISLQQKASSEMLKQEAAGGKWRNGKVFNEKNP